MQLVLTQAKERGAKKVHRIGLRVGELSGVLPDALEFAFSVLTPGTVAENACLEIERVKIACQCSNCVLEFEVEDFNYCCPRCGVTSTKVIRGEELQLSFIEVSAEEGEP